MSLAEGDGSQNAANPAQVGLRSHSPGEELVTWTTGHVDCRARGPQGTWTTRLLWAALVLPSHRPELQTGQPGEAP